MILRQAVSTTRWFNVDLLIEFITNLGGRLVAAQPKGKIDTRAAFMMYFLLTFTDRIGGW